MINLNLVKIGGYGIGFCVLVYIISWLGLMFLNVGEGAFIYAFYYLVPMALSQIGFMIFLVLVIIGLIINNSDEATKTKNNPATDG